MDQHQSFKPEGAQACAQNADAGAPSGAAGPERRFSAQRKLAAVSRLLRGEPLETVARELNITAARLSGWRDRALLAAEAAMKERERDGRDEELLRHLVAWVSNVDARSPTPHRVTRRGRSSGVRGPACGSARRPR